GIVATTAVVAGKLGVAWSVSLVVAVALVVAVVVTAVAALLRRRWPARPADPMRVTLGAALGMIPAIVLGAITVVHGILRPDALSQTYDAVLHYNAIAAILDTHNASSLTIGSLDVPGESGSFYPAAWHDLTSLLVMSGGFAIPVGVNMMSVVIAVVVWPVSCLLLVRQLVGKSAAGLAITGVVSVAFTAYPWDLLNFGVLWPNLLGMSISPAVLALVLSVTGLARDDAIGRGRAWIMLPVAAVATGFAHPNVVFAVIALSLFPIAAAVVRRALRLRREGRLRRGIVEVVAAFVVFLAVWYWSATTPIFATVRDFYWAPFETPARAIGEALLMSTTGYSGLWLLALVVLGGLLLCRRYPRLLWAVVGFVITVFLYVLTASVNSPLTAKFTGFWYNDPHRLAAMLPITAVPIAVAALMYLGRRTSEFAGRRGWLAAVDGSTLANAVRVRSFGAATLVITLLLGVLTGGFYVSKHTTVLHYAYVTPAANKPYDLVDPAEEAFFAAIKKDIPPDEMVANDPWDGSALLWALADRRVLFPHMGISTTPDLRYLAAHLVDAATDPRVCAAADRLHVGFLLIGDATFWPWDGRTKNYPGIVDPHGRRGFQLVASSGDHLKLYRLTACGSAP
ncbi:MAG TPA: DUF6541 family protein, partial [Pseudonocardiaceae bacterium]|nr:DUF6541 family protein [Pseudonocardiaceae bacterium]